MKIVDNFELFKSVMKFDSEDDFLRKKDIENLNDKILNFSNETISKIWYSLNTTSMILLIK